MKVYSEERRVFYSGSFEYPLSVTCLGHTTLQNLHVEPLLHAPALENAEHEARRVLRLLSWLLTTGTFWPPVMLMGPMGPMPFPYPFPWPELLSPSQALQVAVDTAGAAGDIGHVLEEAIRRRIRRGPFHVEVMSEQADDGELHRALRELAIPISCSPLSDITLGQVFESLRSLHLVRRLVPGAVFTAAGVQTVRSFFEGDIMMALGFAVSGTVATMILHAAQPAEAFSNVISRELTGDAEAGEWASPGSPPALPDQGDPAGAE